MHKIYYKNNKKGIRERGAYQVEVFAQCGDRYPLRQGHLATIARQNQAKIIVTRQGTCAHWTGPAKASPVILYPLFFYVSSRQHKKIC
jgi:hypothetical protein